MCWYLVVVLIRPSLMGCLMVLKVTLRAHFFISISYWEENLFTSFVHFLKLNCLLLHLLSFKISLCILESSLSLHMGFTSIFSVCTCMPNHFSHVQICATLWTVAHQAPLSMGFSRQGYWSGLLFPPPEDLPHPGIKPMFHTSCTGRQVLYHQHPLESTLRL